jgi:hypothetical protein
VEARLQQLPYHGAPSRVPTTDRDLVLAPRQIRRVLDVQVWRCSVNCWVFRPERCVLKEPKEGSQALRFLIWMRRPRTARRASAPVRAIRQWSVEYSLVLQL